MALANDSLLTQNPIEVADLEKFILERTFERPELQKIHSVITGVTMKEQIVFASQMGLSGILDGSGCDINESGAGTAFTQKYWEPKPISDRFVWCNVTLNSMFKAYFTKIQNYKDLYNIEGSDLEIFFTIVIAEAMQKTVWRATWLADANVSAAAAGLEGLIDEPTNGQFFNYFDGLWVQIFTAVTATTMKRYTIVENAETTTAAQLALAAGRSVEIFEGVWALADSRLKSDAMAQLLVSNQVFENYRQYLQSKGENFSIGYTMDGLPTLKWNGREVVNMEMIWDNDIQAYFVDNTTNNAYYLPNRVVLTIPANIPVGTLNEDDFSTIDAFYDKTIKKNILEYGFTLDAKELEDYMITVAY